MNNLVIYEDDSILVINKPQGLATTHGKNENVCDIVFSEFPFLESVNGYKKNEGGLLNRLDNETGGIILFAKSNESFEFYSKSMKEGKIEKTYTAIVDGVPEGSSGIIDFSIAHHYSRKKKMTVLRRGSKYRGKPRDSVTRWKLIKTNNAVSRLEISITRGARHQIRVHLAEINLPIIGDKLYNKNENKSIKNHLLYANGIKFMNFYGEEIEIFTEIPFLKNSDLK